MPKSPEGFQTLRECQQLISLCPVSKNTQCTRIPHWKVRHSWGKSVSPRVSPRHGKWDLGSVQENKHGFQSQMEEHWLVWHPASLQLLIPLQTTSRKFALVVHLRSCTGWHFPLDAENPRGSLGEMCAGMCACVQYAPHIKTPFRELPFQIKPLVIWRYF